MPDKDNQRNLLECLPPVLLTCIPKSLKEWLVLSSLSKNLRNNMIMIAPAYDAVITLFLTAELKQIRSFTHHYRSTKYYAELKAKTFTIDDTPALLCFMLVTDDINLLPVPLFEQLLQQEKSLLPQLIQAQWELLKLSIKATLCAIKYGNNPTQENAHAFREALRQGKCFINLSKANLKSITLSPMDAQNINLEWAILQNAHLGMSNLQGVNFKNANLEEALFIASTLKHCNFQGSNLKKTNFYQATLEDVNLGQASLQEADLNQTRINRANLKGAHFIDATPDVAELKTQLQTAFSKQTRKHAQKELLLDAILSDFLRKERRKESLESALNDKIFGSGNPLLLFFERHMSVMLTPSQKKIKKALTDRNSKSLWNTTDTEMAKN